MDDVLIVVGLLLFGSSLFCLCCYKVSNLLYMLYHIDDAESVAGDISTAAVTSAAAALAVAAPQTTASTSAPKISLSPEEKIVKNNGAVKTGAGADYTHLNNFVSSGSNAPPQHHHHHTHHGSQKPSPDVDNRASISMLTLVPSSSTTSLVNEAKQIHKTGSVSSLSVGIQCNPRDVDCHVDIDDVDNIPLIRTTSSRLAMLPTKMSNHRSHVHLSAPDFTSDHLHHQHHHHHQRVPFHHQHDHDAAGNLLNSVHSSSGASDYFMAAAAAAAAAAACRRHRPTDFSSSAPRLPRRGYLDYHTASLGRSTRGGTSLGSSRTNIGTSPLSDSETDITVTGGGMWHTVSPSPQQQQQHQQHNLGKPARPSTTRGPSRRYGSIRVAECSFIEHPDSRNTSPICDPRRPPMPPPKRSSVGPKHRRQTITQINYVPSPFDRFQPVSDDDSPFEDHENTEPYLNVFSPGQNLSHAQDIQGRFTASQCNGPKSAATSSDKGPLPRANSLSGPCVQDIIPPPQDFGGEFSSLSSLNHNNGKSNFYSSAMADIQLGYTSPSPKAYSHVTGQPLSCNRHNVTDKKL